MLRIEGVTVAFGRQIIFEDLSLTLEKPGIYLILGPNASGKSTLFGVLSGRLKPKRGKVFLGDCQLYKLFGRDLPSLEIVRDSFTRDINLPIGTIYKIRAEALGVKKSFKAFCQGYSLPLEFSELAHRSPDQLSTSELLELELALALMGEPNYLFIDDVFRTFSFTSVRRALQNLETRLISGESFTLVSSSRFFGYMDRFSEVFLLKDGKIETLGKAIGEDENKVKRLEQASEELGAEPEKRARIVVVRCGEYFYRHSRIEADNPYFQLKAVLENALVLELKDSIEPVMNYLAETGIDVLAIEFREEHVREELRIGESI